MQTVPCGSSLLQNQNTIYETLSPIIKVVYDYVSDTKLWKFNIIILHES